MNGKLRAQPKTVSVKTSQDAHSTVIMLRRAAINKNTRPQSRPGATEDEAVVAESLRALEQAHREELERLHLQYVERIRRSEAARLENDRSLREEQTFHANDSLLTVAEAMAAAEMRLAQLETQQDALETERQVLHEALQTVREQQPASTVVQAADGYRLRRETRREEVNNKYRGATEQVAALKQRTPEREAAHPVTEQKRTPLPPQLAQLIAEGQAKTAAVHEAEKKLIRLEAELDMVRVQLDEATRSM